MKPYRSLLFVPAHREGWSRKAANAGADALILDLEDAVPMDEKVAARQRLAETISDARQVRPHIGIIVRVNEWWTPYGPSDLEVAVAADIDAVMVPKVETALELQRLDAILGQLERRHGDGDGGPTLEVLATLETAGGMVNRDEIAAAPRVGAVLASAGRGADVARSIGFTWTPEGLETLHFRSGVVLSCRAAGTSRPIVGLWQDIVDLAGLERFATDNRQLGFSGQVLIHPSHVEVVNRVYGPSEADVDYYRGLIAAYDEAVSKGSGAVVYQGEHIDAAHVATAQQMVDLADEVAALD